MANENYENNICCTPPSIDILDSYSTYVVPQRVLHRVLSSHPELTEPTELRQIFNHVKNVRDEKISHMYDTVRADDIETTMATSTPLVQVKRGLPSSSSPPPPTGPSSRCRDCTVMLTRAPLPATAPTASPATASTSHHSITCEMSPEAEPVASSSSASAGELSSGQKIKVEAEVVEQQRARRTASLPRLSALYRHSKRLREGRRDDDAAGSRAKGNVFTPTDTRSKRYYWSKEATDALDNNVRRFGAGNWATMLRYGEWPAKDMLGLTAMALKDKWRATRLTRTNAGTGAAGRDIQ